MPGLITGLLILFLGILLLRAFAKADPRKLAQRLRAGAGLLAVVLGLIFTFTGRAALGLPLVAAGIGLLGSAGVGLPSRTRRTPGGTSRVKTAAIEMELDIDSGAMRGRILAGRFAGRALEALAPAELEELEAELAGDPESSALLEAYLNRRGAGGRSDRQGHADAGRGRGAASGPMSEQEAYQILGLQPGAGPDQIRSAHRSLMKKIHPDQGGTAYLAARVNEAKEVLLRRHG